MVVGKPPESSVSGFVFVSADGSWKGWVMLCGGFVYISYIKKKFCLIQY